MLNFLKAVI